MTDTLVAERAFNKWRATEEAIKARDRAFVLLTSTTMPLHATEKGELLDEIAEEAFYAGYKAGTTP